MSTRRRPGPTLPYRLVAGVEPCRDGWLVLGGRVQGSTVSAEPPFVAPTFLAVMDAKPAYDVIAVHIPIGLLSSDVPGGRRCDREARKLLGWPRGAAILTPPTRGALGSRSFAEAHRHTRGLSALQWGRMARIAEIDREVQPYWQRSVFEVNPELSFFQLNSEKPLTYGKRTQMGRAERVALLGNRIIGVDQVVERRLPGVRREQLLDAAADLWTARRILGRGIARLPEDAEWDDLGIRMELIR